MTSVSIARGRRRRRRAQALAVLVAAASVAAGCGGDDGSDATGTSTRDTAPTAESSDPSVAGGPGGTGACPGEAEISSVLGVDVVVDEASPVQAEGFCPYVAAADPAGLSVTLTFTPLDITQDPAGGEEVTGVGEAARWSPVTDELSVWTGSEGLLVGVSPFGVDLDAKDAAVSLAAHVLDG